MRPQCPGGTRCPPFLPAIARVSISGKAVGPEQALTIEEAMYAHTMVGAYADFAEDKKGSLEAGKLADLTVWHDNPYTVSTQDIRRPDR